MRVKINLKCTSCGSKNYLTSKNTKTHPEKIEVVKDAGVFANTGRMFLQGFDYLYDAAGGYVGYGWNGRVSHEYGGVTPGVSTAR